MLATIYYRSKKLTINLTRPLDISLPLRGDSLNPTAWYMGPPSITPHKEGEFTAAVREGGSVNFNNIYFNPHAHGTHTECVGHITKEVHSINTHLKQYFFFAEVITVAPEKSGDDFVISDKQLRYALRNKKRDAVVIRTLPNTNQKCSQQYSNTNPPYLLKSAAAYLVEKGIQHLLIDLPSVDKEKDNGELLAHRAFWYTEGKIRHGATITELVYVRNSIKDGPYVLDLQVAPFENDASPSRPVLYQIEE